MEVWKLSQQGTTNQIEKQFKSSLFFLQQPVKTQISKLTQVILEDA